MTNQENDIIDEAIAGIEHGDDCDTRLYLAREVLRLRKENSELREAGSVLLTRVDGIVEAEIGRLRGELGRARRERDRARDMIKRLPHGWGSPSKEEIAAELADEEVEP